MNELCEKCKGNFAVVAAVVDQREIQRYLKFIGMPQIPPARGPPRLAINEFDFEEPTYDGEAAIYLAQSLRYHAGP